MTGPIAATARTNHPLGMTRARVLIVAGAFAVYCVILHALVPRFGMAGAPLAMGPVAAAAWLMGPAAGLIASLIATVLNGSALYVLGEGELLTITAGRSIIGSLTIFPIALGIGHLRALSLRLKRHVDLLAERDRSLRRSRVELHALIEAIPDAVAVCRQDLIVYVNPALARLLAGGNAAQLIGRRFGELVFDDGQKLRDSGLREVCFRSAAGAEVVLELSETPAIDWDGSPAQLWVGRDVTERTRFQRRVQLSERLASVGTLASGVAHELNNPLAGVVANLDYSVDVLARLLAGPWRHLAPEHAAQLQEIREALVDSKDGAQRMRLILADLRVLSRVDQPQPARVELRKVLDFAAKLASHQVRPRARLVVSHPPLPPVMADEARLAQVFVNLLVNAAEAIPESDGSQHTVDFTSRLTDDHHVEIEVRDSGRGMPPEVAARIFDPFFTTKSPGHGTGLGLSICHTLVQAMGGDISVASRVGHGTAIKIVLPVAPGATPDVHAAEPAVAPAPVTTRRVLVVDDEPLMARSVRRVLGERWEIEAVNGGQKALRLIEAGERFDVILCDLIMPEMSGMELHSELTRRAPLLAERMVFMTGGAFTPRARQFLDTVPNARLEKPFDGDALRQVLVGAETDHAGVSRVGPIPLEPTAEPRPTH